MNNDNDASKLDNPSRREFLRQGSLLAGGLIAAPLLSRANYFSGADDVIKIALVGCGGRGTGASPVHRRGGSTPSDPT